MTNLILDTKGRLICEDFTQGHPRNDDIRINLKPLAQIPKELTQIATVDSGKLHNFQYLV